MSDNVDYFLALERLKNGKPDRVDKGYKINKDTVALEAGRKRGSIKRGRQSFDALIDAIDEAAVAYVKPENNQRDKIEKYKLQVAEYRNLYEAALAREVMLLRELYYIKKQQNSTEE